MPPRNPKDAVPQADSWSDVPGHERSEVNLLVVGALVAAFVVLAVIMHTALWFWLKSTGPRRVDSAGFDRRVEGLSAGATSAPTLQVSPARDLGDFRSQEQQRLERGAALDSAMAAVARRRGAGGTTAPMSPLELQQGRAAPQRESK